jgi:diaminopimelate epimerase
MTIPFTKMSGAGNDFVVIDNRKSLIQDEVKKAFAEKVCTPKASIGADGVIFVENSNNADFRWDFFNSDGSSAEMCGNGGRCVARFAVDNKIAPPNLSFETIAGIISAEVGDDTVKVKLTPPFDFRQNVEVNIGSDSRIVDCINTGVPHAVLFSDNVDAEDLQTIGSAIRYHDVFVPSGTNVNFVEVTGKDSLKIRTYERGVEGETLACGTGATASAILAALRSKVVSPVNVSIKSGDVLKIYFDTSANNGFGDVFLEGTAETTFCGTLNGN